MSSETAHNANYRARRPAGKEVELLDRKRGVKESAERLAASGRAFAERVKRHHIRQSAGRIKDVKVTMTANTIRLRFKLASKAEFKQRQHSGEPEAMKAGEQQNQALENQIKALPGVQSKDEQRSLRPGIGETLKTKAAIRTGFYCSKHSFTANGCEVVYRKVDFEEDALRLAVRYAVRLEEARKFLEHHIIPLEQRHHS
jgi:hypothetical protein